MWAEENIITKNIGILQKIPATLTPQPAYMGGSCAGVPKINCISNWTIKSSSFIARSKEDRQLFFALTAQSYHPTGVRFEKVL
jgi:hypothetical protein